MARPRKEFNVETFEDLCGIHCTLAEIAGILHISEDTVERRCEEEFQQRFAEVYKRFSADGKMSLRRTQFKMAETNPAMAIWLGKQYLGQREPSQTIRIEEVDSAIDRAVKAHRLPLPSGTEDHFDNPAS